MRSEIKIEELKKIELGILDYIAEICSQNGLKYFLDSGTLLGAIRHKGFIPWDDDIDIIMPRKDYMKLINIIPKKDNKYILLSTYTQSDYYYLFAKIVDTTTELYEKFSNNISNYGVYVDIFPLDNLPDDEQERISFQKHAWNLHRIYNYQFMNAANFKILPFKKKIIYILSRTTNKKRLSQQLDNLYRKYENVKSTYVGYLLGGNCPFSKLPAKYFNNPIKVQFEGKEYYTIEKYDEYLTMLYGDYMKLPPMDKRASHHAFKAYWK